MLNHIVLMGRLTRDPELRYTQSQIPVASFRLAVDRDFGGRRLRLDRLHQRRELFPQRGKQRPQHGHGHTVVGFVDQRVSDVPAGRPAEILGCAAAELQRLFQQRLHGGEVIRRSRHGPRLVGARRVARQFSYERGRQLGRPLVFAAGDANEAGFVVVVGQRFLVGLQVLQQLAQRGRGELFLSQPAERGQLLAARLSPARRHVGRLVPVQQRRSPMQVVHLLQPRFQLG